MGFGHFYLSLVSQHQFYVVLIVGLDLLLVWTASSLDDDG
jgi:hypothetical protein